MTGAALPRRTAAAVALDLLVLLLAAATAGAQAVGPHLDLPRPPLERADPQVREQVAAARGILDRLLATGAPPEAVDAALARVCRTYLAYELLEAAEPCLAGLAGRQPDDGEWPYLLAYLEERAGRPEASRERLRTSVGLSAYAPAYLRLGDLELAAGRLAEARAAYEAGIEADPRCVAGRYGLAAVARREGDLERAVALLRGVLEELPGSPQARYALALDLRRLGRRDEALELLREVDLDAMRLRPWWGCPDPRVGRLSALVGGSSAHLMRGLEASFRGDFEREEAEYRKAVAASPDDPVARKSLGTALYRAGEHEAAEAELREAVRLAPDDPSYRFDLGQVLLELGRPEAAAAELRRAVELDPDMLLAHRRLADLEAEAGRPERAAEHLARIAALDPPDTASRARLVMTLLGLGRQTEARGHLARLLAEQPPPDLPTRLQLASLLGNLGDLDGAERQFLAVLELGAEPAIEARAHALLGQLHLIQGRREEAAERFRDALRLDPTLAEARDGLRQAEGAAP